MSSVSVAVKPVNTMSVRPIIAWCVGRSGTKTTIIADTAATKRTEAKMSEWKHMQSVHEFVIDDVWHRRCLSASGESTWAKYTGKAWTILEDEGGRLEDAFLMVYAKLIGRRGVMDQKIEYTKTTHEVSHYFLIDEWMEVRWRKAWNRDGEHESVEILDNGGWKKLSDHLTKEYLKAFCELFYGS
jgi:hypothetical protein